MRASTFTLFASLLAAAAAARAPDLETPSTAEAASSTASSQPRSASRLADGLLNQNEAIRRLRGRLAALPPDITCTDRVVYRRASGQNLDFDVYRAKSTATAPADAAAPRPGILYIHGGGWRGGDKRTNRGLFIDLARQGYVVFSVEYRLVPKAIFPACIDDCRAALRFIRAHADDYHLDPQRIALIGSSAGGHLAALMAVADDGEFRTGENTGQSHRVNAVVALYGVFDLRNLPRSTGLPLVTALLGGPESAIPDAYRRASPQAWVESAATQPARAKELPAFLFIHGDADRLIDIGQAVRMNAALHAAGRDSQLITVHNGGHGLATGRMDPSPKEFRRRMSDFLAAHLRPQSDRDKAATQPGEGDRK